MFVDADVETSGPIQPDIAGVSLATPLLLIEATIEEVLYLFIIHSAISRFKSLNQDFPYL